MLTAAVLFDRAVGLVNAGKHASARRALDAASQRATDANLRARIAGTTSYLVLETGAVDEADALCRSALRIRGLTTHTRSVLHGQLGLVALHRGDLGEALRLFGLARKGLDDDPVVAGTIAMNRGNALLEAGRFAEAGEEFGVAAKLLHSAGLRDDAAKATHNQGYASLLTGDLVSALRYMNAARARASAASPVDAAVGDVDRAEALVAAGMPFEASAALADAAAVYRARRLRLRQADAVWRRARTLLYFDPAAAGRLAREASRLYESHGNVPGALRASAVALRAEVRNGGHSARLETELEHTADELARHGLRDESKDLRLVTQRVRVRRGGQTAAREALRSIRVDRDAPITRRVLAREVRAEAAEVLSDDRRVVREAARGLDELAEWQAVFRSVDLQTSAAMHGQALTKAGIAAALRSGDVGSVFEWSERARSIASHAVLPRPPADSRVAADLAELRGLRLMPKGHAEQRREAELRERIRSRQWSKAGKGVVSAIASLDDVQGALDERTVVVAYLWSGERLVALVVEPDAVRVVDSRANPFSLTEKAALFADLDMHAARLGGALGDSVGRSLDHRLGALDNLLVEPVMSASALAAAPGTKVVVVAPGILAGIPWAMLGGLAGHPVTAPLSATRWIADCAVGRHRGGDDSVGFVVGPGVPRAAEEAKRSASEWPDATIIDGADATTDAASGLASSVDVFHVTGHGRHAVDNPHFSGIELVDGPWFGYDIERVERMPSTVVISACELGRSSIGWGHEALGMARTWLHAGSHSVIASPVSVNDGDACELLSAVHARLATGEPPAVALAAATESTGIATPFLCYGAGW